MAESYLSALSGRQPAFTGMRVVGLRDALITQPTAKATLRVVGGLAPGTAYTFTIAAVTANGVGAPATVKATTPPA